MSGTATEVAVSRTATEVAVSRTATEVAVNLTATEVAVSRTATEVAVSRTEAEIAVSGTETEIAVSRTATEVAVSRTETEIAMSGLGFQPRHLPFRAMAVSGAAGQRRLPTDTNHSPIGMRGRRGRQKTFLMAMSLMAMRIEMPANPGHSRSSAPRPRLL